MLFFPPRPASGESGPGSRKPRSMLQTAYGGSANPMPGRVPQSPCPSRRKIIQRYKINSQFQMRDDKTAVRMRICRSERARLPGHRRTASRQQLSGRAPPRIGFLRFGLSVAIAVRSFPIRFANTLFYLPCAPKRPQETRCSAPNSRPASSEAARPARRQSRPRRLRPYSGCRNRRIPARRRSKYALVRGLSPHAANVLCYKNNAIGLFDKKIGPKFAGGGFFVSLHCPSTTLELGHWDEDATHILREHRSTNGRAVSFLSILPRLRPPRSNQKMQLRADAWTQRTVREPTRCPPLIGTTSSVPAAKIAPCRSPDTQGDDAHT